MPAVALATCLTLAAAFKAAGPGDVIRLKPAPTPCPYVELRGRSFPESPLVIEAGDTVFAQGLRILRVEGITLRGGIYHSIGGSTPYSLHVRDSARVRVEGGRFTQALRGLAVGRTRDIAILDNRFYDLGAEGINLAGVEGFEVRGNDIRDFSPRPPTCTAPDGRIEERVRKADCVARGHVWKDGNHPDCVQFWGGSANGVVAGNRCTGEMQGIFGGVSGALVERNVLEVTFPNAIRLGGTGNRVRFNEVRTVPTARFKPMILLKGEGNMACGNRIETPGSREATRPCTAAEAAG